MSALPSLSCAPYLPAQLQSQLSLGRLQAHILPASADLTLTQTTYVQQPLGLSTHVTWTGGLKASGTLTHPGTALSFAYDGQNLDVSGPLNAWHCGPSLLASGRLP